MTWSPSTPSALVPGDVHVFLASTDSVAPATLAYFETLLSSEEREKAGRLLVAVKRTESLIARGMLRQILANYLKKTPQQVVICVKPGGKPFIESSSLRFNVSHTSGKVLIAVTLEQEVGVDIEEIRSDCDYDNLARRFFAPTEYGNLLAVPPGERVSAFFHCWTRKEALLKGTGMGISGLASCEVPLQASASPLSLVAPFQEWTLHDLAVPSTHIASLAIQSSSCSLRYWSMD